MRSRRPALLQLHAMHRSEDRLSRPLSELRYARKPLLRRKHVRHGLLRSGRAHVSRSRRDLHRGRHLRRRQVCRVRWHRTAVLPGRHMQHRLLRHHGGKRENMPRRRRPLLVERSLYGQEHVLALRGTRAALLRQRPLRCRLRVLVGQVPDLRRSLAALLHGWSLYQRCLFGRHVLGMRWPEPTLLPRRQVPGRAGL
jgi:hypothetical protein